MNDTEFEFDRATRVVDGAGELHDGWDIGGNANGGYLLALAANGLRTLAGRPDPISVTAHYLSPGRPGPVEVEGQVVKEGRRFATWPAGCTVPERRSSRCSARSATCSR